MRYALNGDTRQIVYLLIKNGIPPNEIIPE